MVQSWKSPAWDTSCLQAVSVSNRHLKETVKSSVLVKTFSFSFVVRYDEILSRYSLLHSVGACSRILARLLELQHLRTRIGAQRCRDMLTTSCCLRTLKRRTGIPENLLFSAFFGRLVGRRRTVPRTGIRGG